MSSKQPESSRYEALCDEHFESDPAVQGGSLVIKGTRTPVLSLAVRLLAGEDIAMIREDYPHVSEEVLGLAVLWALKNPAISRLDPNDPPILDLTSAAIPDQGVIDFGLFGRMCRRSKSA